MSTLKEKTHQLAIHCAAVQVKQMSEACEANQGSQCYDGKYSCVIPCGLGHMPCECHGQVKVNFQGCRECPEFDWEEWDFQHAKDNI